MGNKMGDIIRKLRLERNLTQDQLAEGLGVSTSVIRKWESNNRIPKYLFRETICDYFGIDMNYLMGLTPIKVSLSEEKIIQIPLYEYRGLDDRFNQDHVVDTIIRPRFMLKEGPEYFAVCIRDNSVVDFNLKKGDIAVFEKTKILFSKQIGLFMVNGTICCRYYMSEKKYVRLMTLNSDYETYENVPFVTLGRLALNISNDQDDFIPDKYY